MNFTSSREHEEWGYCQAGTSAMLTEDNSALIGAPGPFTWRGTVFAVSVAHDFLFRDKTHYHTAVNPDESPVGKYSYLGMSLAAGNFLPPSRRCDQPVSYAAGAPRAGGTGKVLIFVKCKREILRVEQILTGESFASSFGYTLAAVDINGDHMMDLFVGAPFHYDPKAQDSNQAGLGGAVYVYMNHQTRGITQLPPIRLTGFKAESRFGFAISSAGDLNNDGYQDVVIGAPYDDDGGKVYVYMGNEKGLHSGMKPDQVISGRDLPFRKIKTFGYSLSGGLDMDMNNHSDIVVGSYESDAAIIIRTRPVVDIGTWFGRKPNSIDPELYGCEGDVRSTEVCFRLESCFMIKNFPPNIDRTFISYRLMAEVFPGGRKVSRIRFGDAKSNASHVSEKTAQVGRNSLSGCFHETVYLKEGTTDIRTPVKFLLTLRLQQDEPRYQGEEYGVSNINQFPILNQQEAQKELELPFHKSCGDDDLCSSNLKADLTIHGLDRGTGELEISERGDVVLRLSVSNFGEPAYSASLEIAFDETFSYVGRSDSVSDIHCDIVKNHLITCDLGNPYPSNRTSILSFRVQPLTPKSEVKFFVKTNTSSEDVRPPIDHEVQIPVKLIKRAEVSIRSSVEPKNIWYGSIHTDEEINHDNRLKELYRMPRIMSDIGNKITHTFQITNDGPWQVEEMDVIIDWPYQLASGSDAAHGGLLYLTEEPEITPPGAGRCFINPRSINSMGLRHNSRAYSISSSSSYKYSKTIERKVEYIEHRRKKRRRKRTLTSNRNENELDSDFTLKDDGVTVTKAHFYDAEEASTYSASNAELLDCLGDNIRCHTFDCRISGLRANESAVIRFRSRIWNSTLMQEFEPSAKVVVVQTSARIILPESLDIQQTYLDNDVTSASLVAYPRITEGSSGLSGVPLWIILVSVAVGLVVVTLIATALWKLGFFRRNRLSDDVMMSAKITSNNGHGLAVYHDHEDEYVS